jgi:cysteine-rich repeat protein
LGGDGNLELGEECDDGNTEDLDGCDSECRIEQCLINVPGDINVSGAVTSADIIGLLYIFKPGKGPPQPCEANGDVNCSGAVTSADIIYLVNFVFKGTGPPPCDICNESPMAADCN